MKNVVIALVFGMLSLPILAQEGPRDGAKRSPEERAKMMVQKMAESLDLNEDQIEKISPLLIEFHKERAKAHEAEKKSHEDLREKLASILSEDQMEKLDQKMKERRKKRSRGRHHAEPRPEPQDQ